ncbi:OmpA family protein [Acidocella facilis]|uniref:OmpA family protein n=1 Tax=Acidocella facilis TaxID=525 RepID=UPI001F4678FF|nr:OmpA family protein [Acidocella facilis]
MKISVWLCGLLLVAPAYAHAQVTVNQAALRQLQGLPEPAPVAAPAARPAMARPHKIYKRHTENHAAVKPVLAVAKPAPAPKPAPPAPQPVVAKPVAPPAPPKPSIPSLATLDFAPGSAALPVNAQAVLKPFCAASTPVPVIAHAPRDPNDASGAMRLSLARAFAIRDALTACGVNAANVIPRAAGPAKSGDSNQAEIGAGAKP